MYAKTVTATSFYGNAETANGLTGIPNITVGTLQLNSTASFMGIPSSACILSSTSNYYFQGSSMYLSTNNVYQPNDMTNAIELTTSTPPSRLSGAQNSFLYAQSVINAMGTWSGGSNAATADMSFQLNGTEFMHASSGGFVGVGVGNPVNSFEVAGNICVKRNIFNDYTFKVGGGEGSVTNLGSTNSAYAIMYVSSANGRSINCSGTVNVNGADYAEYLSKNGPFTVAKGDIIGMDSNNMITNNFSEAVVFGIKSTNPSYVGGDNWGSNIGIMPNPGTYAKYDVDPNYLQDLANWTDVFENARSNVDRIAFCGRVPVNVYHASPGDYIIPVIASDGAGITGSNVPANQMTLPMFMSAVGQVLQIMEDGRAFVLVK